MKNIIKIIVVTLCIVGCAFSKNTVLAANGYYTLSYPDKGVENIEVPSELAIITRTESYNTDDLCDYNVDPSDIRKYLNGTNTYVCAMSYDGDYEINIDFFETDEGMYLGDIADFTDTELEKTLGALASDKASDVKMKYVEMNGTPAIKITAYIDDLDQYLEGYACTSESNGKYYGVVFKLYTYGGKPTSFMENNLNNMVENAVITQPESTYNAMHESKGMLDRVLEKAIEGVITGALAILVGFVIHGNKKKKSLKTGDAEQREKADNGIVIDGLKTEELIRTDAEKPPVAENETLTLLQDNASDSLKDISPDCLEDKRKADDISVPKRLFCRKCGAQLPIDSVYCNKCGERVIR